VGVDRAEFGVDVPLQIRGVARRASAVRRKAVRRVRLVAVGVGGEPDRPQDTLEPSACDRLREGDAGAIAAVGVGVGADDVKVGGRVAVAVDGRFDRRLHAEGVRDPVRHSVHGRFGGTERETRRASALDDVDGAFHALGLVRLADVQLAAGVVEGLLEGVARFVGDVGGEV